MSQPSDNPRQERTVGHAPSDGPDARTIVTPGVDESQGHVALSIPGYDVLNEIGRGGMGVVYRARQISLNRIVALKVILAGVVADESGRTRFRREAQAIGQLQHPHIVQIHEVGEWHSPEGETLPYFSLEYCAGGSLDEYLDGTPLPPVQSASLVEILSRAVQAAHQQQLIHRDLKPANVLLVPVVGQGESGFGGTVSLDKTEEEPSPLLEALAQAREATVKRQGSDSNVDKSDSGKSGHKRRPATPGQAYLPKITDFGLARRTDEQNQTASGAILGTPSYMAPEQARGKSRDIGPACDVYALGAILYESLTGRPPFKGATAVDTIMQVMKLDPVPPSRLSPNVPRDLDTICLKCLEKEPGKRYGSADSLGDDLRRYLENRPIHARPLSLLGTGWRWCRRNPVVAALSMVLFLSLFLGTGVAWYLALDALKAKELAEDKTKEAIRNAGEANRSKKEALDSAAESRRRLTRMCVSNGVRAAEDGDLFLAMQWFAEPLVRDPDNRETEATARARLAAYWFASTRPTSTLMLSYPQRSAETYTRTPTAFSSDGRLLATIGSDLAIRVIDTLSGESIGKPLIHAKTVLDLNFNPDGKSLVSTCTDGTIRAWNFREGNVLHSVFDPLVVLVKRTVIHPNGQWVAAMSQRSVAHVWDLHTGKRLHEDVRKDVHGRGIGFTPDGKSLVSVTYGSNRKHTYFTLEVRDTETWALRYPPIPCTHVALSANSLWALLGLPGSKSQLFDVRTGQAAGSSFQPGRINEPPVLDSEGRHALNIDSKNAQIWDVRAGKPTSPRLKMEGYRLQASFCSTNNALVTGGTDGTVLLWDAAAGESLGPPLRHRQAINELHFSPEGRQVVVVSRDQQAYVWDLSRRLPVSALKLPRGSLIPTADGYREVLEGSIVVLTDPQTGRPTARLPHDAPNAGLAFSGDGRRLATCTARNVLRVWDTATGKPVGEPIPMPDSVEQMVLDRTGERILATVQERGKQPEVRMIDARTGRTLFEPLPMPDRQADVFGPRRSLLQVFSPDNRRFLSHLLDARVRDATTGEPVSPFLTHTPGAIQTTKATQAAFSPDGKRVAISYMNRDVRIWEVESGKVLSRWTHHRETPTVLAFSADGRWLATGGTTGEATRVWSVETGQPVSPTLGQAEAVDRLTFSPDQRFLMTMSGLPRVVRVWEIETGQPITPPLYGDGNPLSAAFDADGHHVLLSPDSHCSTIPLTMDGWTRDDLVKWTRLLTGHRLDSTGTLEALSVQELRDIRQSFLDAHADAFRVDPADVLLWHVREAQSALSEKNIPAALHHLRQFPFPR